jgi:hypothetical protein
MSRTPTVPTILAVAVVLVQLAAPPIARADDPDDPGRYKNHGDRPGTTVAVRVDPAPNGYDVQISARVRRPGGEGRAERSEDRPSAHPLVQSGEPPAPPRAPAPTDPGESRSVARPAPVVVAEPWIGPARPPASDPPSVPAEDAGSPRITVTPIMATVWGPTGEGTADRPRRTPEFLGYYTYVNGTYQGVTWQAYPPGPAIPPGSAPPLPPDQRPGGGGGLDPYSVALDILAHIPLPDMRLRTSPALGLVALPSWYWVEGYGGQPFGEARTITLPPANPDDPNDHGTSFTVVVRVWPSTYAWAFGDGKALTTRSLGRAYPSESDIQHTYEHSSLAYPSGFPVRMTAEFGAEFRVDGGGPQGLPSVRRTYGSAFRVQEVQPVLVQRR